MNFKKLFTIVLMLSMVSVANAKSDNGNNGNGKGGGNNGNGNGNQPNPPAPPAPTPEPPAPPAPPAPTPDPTPTPTASQECLASGTYVECIVDSGNGTYTATFRKTAHPKIAGKTVAMTYSNGQFTFACDSTMDAAVKPHICN